MRTGLVVVALAVVACGDTGGNDDVTMADFVGSWTGGWHDTTFDTEGDASMEIAVADPMAGTASLALDLDGEVFGMADPDPLELTGPYDLDGIHLSGNAELLGVYTLDFDLAAGTVSGMSDPGVGSIDHVDWTGTAEPSAIDLTYTILDGDGAEFATGTLSFTK